MEKTWNEVERISIYRPTLFHCLSPFSKLLTRVYLPALQVKYKEQRFQKLRFGRVFAITSASEVLNWRRKSTLFEASHPLAMKLTRSYAIAARFESFESTSPFHSLLESHANNHDVPDVFGMARGPFITYRSLSNSSREPVRCRLTKEVFKSIRSSTPLPSKSLSSSDPLHEKCD